MYYVGQLKLMLLGVPPLGFYNHNTVGENADFKAIRENISQTVISMAMVVIINRKSHRRFGISLFRFRFLR